MEHPDILIFVSHQWKPNLSCKQNLKTNGKIKEIIFYVLDKKFQDYLVRYRVFWSDLIYFEDITGYIPKNNF